MCPHCGHQELEAMPSWIRRPMQRCPACRCVFYRRSRDGQQRLAYGRGQCPVLLQQVTEGRRAARAITPKKRTQTGGSAMVDQAMTG